MNPPSTTQGEVITGYKLQHIRSGASIQRASNLDPRFRRDIFVFLSFPCIQLPP